MSRAEVERFLRELAFSGNVSFACQAATVTRRRALAYRAAHHEFERLWRWAQEQARENLEKRLA